LGAPVVLSFWTTWCPYCLRQTPILVAAQAVYAEQGVQFVGINVRESADPVADYLAAHGVTYPNVLDTHAELAQRYQISGFPTTFFLNTQGEVVARHIGQLTAELIDGYLAPLIEENSVAASAAATSPPP
jgi:thiol-disulfide isomerase/thioredoxin